MKRNKTSLKLFLTTFYINLSTFEFKVFEDLFLKKKSNSKYQCFFQAAGCEQDLCWCCECHWWLFSRMLTNVKLRVQVHTLMFVVSSEVCGLVLSAMDHPKLLLTLFFVYLYWWFQFLSQNSYQSHSLSPPHLNQTFSGFWCR